MSNERRGKGYHTTALIYKNPHIYTPFFSIKVSLAGLNLTNRLGK